MPPDAALAPAAPPGADAPLDDADSTSSSPALSRQPSPLYSRLKNLFPLVKSRSSASLSSLVVPAHPALPTIITTSPPTARDPSSTPHPAPERLSTSSASHSASSSTRTSASTTHRPTNISQTHLHVVSSATVASAVASTHIHFHDEILTPRTSAEEGPRKSSSSTRLNEGAGEGTFLARMFPGVRKSPRRTRRKNTSSSSMEEVARSVEYERGLMAMSAPASPKLEPQDDKAVEGGMEVTQSTSSEYFPVQRGRSSTVSSVGSETRSRRVNPVVTRGRESGWGTPTERSSEEATGELPVPEEGETAEAYYARLQASDGGLPRSVKKLLESQYPLPASFPDKSDPLHSSALQIYLQTIAFEGYPLDMAMRYLLLHLPLPPEQGAIYRLLDLFARRYLACNPLLWDSVDQILVVCYSILMLNTDVWNSNNKTKMTREQYVRNTSGQGACEDILSCWYDNITLTPFIDSTNPLFSRLHNQKGIASISQLADRTMRAVLDTYIPLIDAPPTTSLDELKIIYSTKGKQFRRVIEQTPSYTGTQPTLDIDAVHAEVESALRVTLLNRSRAKSEGFTLRGSTGSGESGRLVKVGVFSRREKVSRFGRGTGLVWVDTGVLLLETKILFFRHDLALTQTLMVPEPDRDVETIIPPLGGETVLDLAGILAVYDPTHSGEWTVRLVPVAGETEFLRFAEEETMNSWVAAVNYLAALTTAVNPPLDTETAINMMRRRAGTMAPPAGRPVPLRAVSSTLELRGRSKSEQAPPQPSKLDSYIAFRGELEAKLPLQKIGADALLRQARGLLVQTPLQEKTRILVLSALERVTKRLKTMRLELERTKAYMHVLSALPGGIRLVESSGSSTESFQLPVLELRRGHARQRTSDGTTNTMLSSRTLYGALVGEGVPVRRIGVASPTASPTSERGPPTPATPRPTLDVEVEVHEKEEREKERVEEEEPVMREKAPLLAEKTGFEGIQEIARIVREGGF